MRKCSCVATSESMSRPDDQAVGMTRHLTQNLTQKRMKEKKKKRRLTVKLERKVNRYLTVKCMHVRENTTDYSVMKSNGNTVARDHDSRDWGAPYVPNGGR